MLFSLDFGNQLLYIIFMMQAIYSLTSSTSNGI